MSWTSSRPLSFEFGFYDVPYCFMIVFRKEPSGTIKLGKLIELQRYLWRQFVLFSSRISWNYISIKHNWTRVRTCDLSHTRQVQFCSTTVKNYSMMLVLKSWKIKIGCFGENRFTCQCFNWVMAQMLMIIKHKRINFRVWDLRNVKSFLCQMLGHNYAVRRVRCSPYTGQHIATCSYDFTVR